MHRHNAIYMVAGGGAVLVISLALLAWAAGSELTKDMAFGMGIVAGIGGVLLLAVGISELRPSGNRRP